MTKTLAKRYLDLVNGEVDGHARWSIENARVSRPKEHADARVGTFCDRNLATAGLMTREGARDSAGKGTPERRNRAPPGRVERDRRARR